MEAGSSHLVQRKGYRHPTHSILRSRPELLDHETQYEPVIQRPAETFVARGSRFAAEEDLDVGGVNDADPSSQQEQMVVAGHSVQGSRNLTGARKRGARVEERRKRRHGNRVAEGQRSWASGAQVRRHRTNCAAGTLLAHET